MSGVAISYDLLGIEPYRDALSALVASGADMTPLMEAMGGAMADATVMRFESETEPDGTPWMPSWRARHEGGQTLSRTGRLKQSFNPARPGAVEAGPTHVEWGTNIDYAPTHQFGAVIHPKSKPFLAFTGVEGHLVFAANVVIPARPMVGISAEDRLTLEDLAVAFLADVASPP